MGIIDNLFDLVGAGHSPEETPDHPYSRPAAGVGSPRRGAGMLHEAASTGRSEPVNVLARVAAERIAIGHSFTLSNGPWAARVIRSFDATSPRRPPDTIVSNARPVPWIVAYVVEDPKQPGTTPHSHVPSPIENRRDGTLMEQKMHWAGIHLLFQVGVFLREDSDPDGHLPQPNDSVYINFIDARNPSLGGTYRTVDHSGFQSPTELLSTSGCEPEEFDVSYPDDGERDQAPRQVVRTSDCLPIGVSPSSLRDLVDELIAVGDASGHVSEVIPTPLLEKIIISGEFGLLGLFMAVANWGVEWCQETDPPRDPAGRSWAGPRLGSGKHLRDTVRGGLGIPHIDSSWLRDTYERWGDPRGIPSDVLRDLNHDSMIRSEHRDRWADWADRLVRRSAFQHWVVSEFYRRKWSRADRTNDTIATKILNLRIRNSASGIGSRAAGLSFDEQAQRYINFRERGTDRRGRQVNMVRRVVSVLQSYGYE